MDGSPHILVVDDDKEIRALLARFLVEHGFRVATASDSRTMWKALDEWRIDLVVLDVMLPGEDGFSICRRLRANSSMPIVMLTAVGKDTDRIVGLELGADDYLCKPFNPRELVARIKAVLRRIADKHATRRLPSFGKVRFVGWTLDLANRQLESPERIVVDLSTGEYNLLAAFIERPQRVLTREQLLDVTRARNVIPFDRSIDIQVSRLRQKIEPDPKKPTLIKTVRGDGYIFAAEVEPA